MNRSTLVAAVSAIALAWAVSPALAQDVQALRIGTSVNGALTDGDAATTGDDAYRYDDYRFEARAGQRLEAVLRSEAFDAYLAIYADDADAPLTEDDDGLNEETNARLRFTPETSGTYILRARTLSGTDGGDYSLSLREREAPPRAPRPSGLRVGAEQTGELTGRDPELEDGGRYDAYAFRAAAGQRLIVTLKSEAFDPKVLVGRMNGADFVELAQNDDGPDDGLNSRLVFTAPTAGEYVIRAAALQEGEGRYTVGLTEAPPAPPAKPIAIGDSLDGNLNEDTGANDEGQRAEFYRFSVTAGQRVAIELSSKDFDTYLTLRKASDNSVVAEDDDGAGSGTDSRIAQTLEDAGDYVVEARAFSGDGEGRFKLKLEEVAPPPAPSALTFGQTVEGEITPDAPQDDEGKHYDAYVFSGTEGQRVQAILRSGDFDAVLAIGSAEDEFSALATDDDGLGEGTDSRLNLTLPSTGDYVIRASPLTGEDKGLYALELIDRGPEPKPGSVLVGATARGTLTVADALTEEGAYFDAYRFQAKKDEKLRITLVSNAFDAFIDLGEDGEDFSSIASDDDSLSDTHAKLDWTAPEDGWYVVRARSLGPNETGAYALTVERQP
ncbi:PPC domain-containing protein [Brevundimonas sp. SL130]|uniref:PPC domain-containing protein n=1 Tax=Brevundimonas sp. SL130 TaxID=2995143 RepID=UPI00226D06A1|nr:PPC domain-containing protein [Brevundimonas sp. SL130]WAC58549.1 PPC domain-containing protein [Brevundimonas sp. SL130]